MDKFKPITVWLTGLPSSGKTTLGSGLKMRLLNQSYSVVFFDGDDVRKTLCSDLGFSEYDRFENIRRVASVAKLLNNQGFIAVCCFVSPLNAMRNIAREIIGENSFCEVFVDASINVCSSRDVKGLYRKASKGLIDELTGVTAPYEKPVSPKIHIHTDLLTIDQSIEKLYSSVIQIVNSST